MRSTWLVVTLLCTCTSALSGQIPFLSNLFGKATNFNAYLILGSGRGVFESADLSGFGTEVNFGAGKLIQIWRACSRESAAARDSTSESLPECPRADTTRTLTEIHLSARGASRPDTLYVYSASESTPELKDRDEGGAFESVGHWISLDVTIGYALVTGFRTVDSAFDLRGSIQELPLIAGYASLTKLRDVDSLPFGFYVGVRSGLVQLTNMRAHVPVRDTTGSVVSERVFSAGGSTFQTGVTAGVVFDPFIKVGGPIIVAEGQYTWRTFHSVEWTPTEGVPPQTPRELDVGGWTFAIGAQVKLP